MSNSQNTGRGWTWFLWTAAAFNFVIGAVGMFTETSSVDTRTVGILVFAFGIVYAVTARDPHRYASVLWAGVFGKVAIVALFVSVGLSGPTAGVISVVLACDILFAFGFLLFLLTRNDESAKAETIGATDQGEH